MWADPPESKTILKVDEHFHMEQYLNINNVLVTYNSVQQNKNVSHQIIFQSQFCHLATEVKGCISCDLP